MSSSSKQRDAALKTRTEIGNAQRRTGVTVPPTRCVVNCAMAVATTLAIGRPACADEPGADVEDGSVLGHGERRLTFQPTPDLGAAEEPESASGWVIEGGPILFAAGIDGDATVAGVTAELDLSVSDIFDNFDVVGIAGRMEAWKDERYGIIFEGTYLELNGEFNTHEVMPSRLSVDITQVQIDLGAGVRLFDEPLGKDADGARLRLDLLGGARYQYLEEKITPHPLPTLGGSEDWLEPFIGGRARLRFNDSWSVIVLGDASGFGIGSASELTWNLLTTVEYRFNNRILMEAGYKVQGFEYSNGSGMDQFGADWTTQGLLLHVDIHF